jgi:hypothetical protein
VPLQHILGFLERHAPAVIDALASKEGGCGRGSGPGDQGSGSAEQLAVHSALQALEEVYRLCQVCMCLTPEPDMPIQSRNSPS